MWGFGAFYVLGLEIALSVWSSLRKGANQSWASVMPNSAKGPGFPVSPSIPQRFFCKRTQRCFPEAETRLCVLAKRTDENDKDMCGTWGETKYSGLDLPH